MLAIVLIPFALCAPLLTVSTCTNMKTFKVYTIQVDTLLADMVTRTVEIRNVLASSKVQAVKRLNLKVLDYATILSIK